MTLFLSLILTNCGSTSTDNPEAIYFKVKFNQAAGDHSSDPLSSDPDITFEDNAVLMLPGSYSDTGPPARLVYCAHGAGGGVSENDWFLKRFGIIDTLLENGYAVFDVNGGKNTENMGGSLVIQSAYEAYLYILKNYNVLEEILVIGLSMGGLSSSNFVYRHHNVVLAHGMYSPVLSLKDQGWENPWFKTTRKQIAQAFYFQDTTGTTWEQQKVNGWDPLYTQNFIHGQDTFKTYPTPVKIWHGTKDPVVSIDASRKFHRFISNSNGYSELREIESDDHGLSVGNRWMNHELMLFFKKFDN